MNAKSQLQYLLTQYGFYSGDLDGLIGAKSRLAIKTANEYFHLGSMDTASETLYKCLMTFVRFDRSLPLKSDQYFNEPTKKDEFVVHHTAGWVVDKHGKNNMNHVAGWNNTPDKIATAYSIGYDGTIYEHYNPSAWSYHLGLSVAGSLLKTKESIGVEITNEGELEKTVDGFKFWAGKYNRTSDIPIPEDWRGFKFWAPYSHNQLLAVCKLTTYAHFRYGIPLVFAPNAKDIYKPAVEQKFKGIYSHSNVRTDKRDVSPAFPWTHYVSKVQEFVSEIQIKYSHLDF